MCLRTMKNDLTRELMNEMDNNDFSTRRDEKCVIDHLKKVTQGFDENILYYIYSKDSPRIRLSNPNRHAAAF
ncbi:unnamed protein product [Brachionus calyciflorus]|uniref:Uncharacterized protein n=1 Tax=Brachionus calyciflorus TaxID=104777 RepID=A0A814SRR9_9BILA|nr:unnamed protein product [Brachionus calyciflorus]